jgi:hypothetical protein
VDPKGYYSILGVFTNSSYTQIKRAYRDLALKYHPDRNNSPMAADMMRKINEAYEVLSYKQKRFDYDHAKDAVGYSIKDAHETYTKYSNYRNKEEKRGRANPTNSSYYSYYNFNSQSEKDYAYRKVSVWWQMLFSLIPLINFWAFFRIQRLELSLTSLSPIFVGIIVLLAILPEYYFFPLKYEDRTSLFILLFAGALVFFVRRWSIKWNEQINKGQIPNGDNIDKKVRLTTQLALSIIPFANFAAFARIYYFKRSLIIGIPTYISMIFITNAIIQTNTSLFYPVYLILTSLVFIVFMYRWTNRYNLGEYKNWSNTGKNT